jgi:tetratricopeptide (TPR) repeat protein
MCASPRARRTGREPARRPAWWHAALRGAAVAAAIALSSPGLAQSQGSRAEAAKTEARAAEAKRLHDLARELYDDGEYRKAIEKLEQALALDPEGKELVYNLGLIHEKLAEPLEAERWFRRYLEVETDPVLRERTLRALKRIEGVKRDQAAARARQVESAAPTGAPAPSAAPPPPPPPSTTTRPVGPWVWITGGVAVSALIVGNAFAISAVSKSPGSDARTGGSVGVADLQADADAAHSRAIIADVSFVVALLAGAGAAYLYLSTPPVPRTAAPHHHPPRRAGTRGQSVAATF